MTSQLRVLSPNDVAFALHGGKRANVIDMGRTRPNSEDVAFVNESRTRTVPVFSEQEPAGNFTQPRKCFLSKPCR